MVLLHNIHAHLWRIQNRIYKRICSRCFCLSHSIKNNSRIFLYILFFSFFILIQLVRELWTRSLPYPPIIAKNRCKRQKEFMEGPLKNSQNLKERTCAGVSFVIGSQLCQKRGSSTVVLLWILQFFKNTFFREHLRTNASEYRKNMPRTFKTKCEKNDSDNTLITNIYILMVSTYTRLNYNISIQTPCKHKAKLIAVTTWYRHKYRHEIAVHIFNIVTNTLHEM